MNRARLLAEISGAGARAGAGPEDVVFIGRWGDDYRWSTGSQVAFPAGAGDAGADYPGPDAWIFYSGPWPLERPEELPAFLEDLLAEMESMCGGTDRCRWPLDQPYPAGH